ncbi:MAG TPA: HPr family phosphocarrier protein [Candidatus Polarisedimenticolia bacterium]|nr:HPr family phosphocarrier protein [Candidatus Polarisedimenticolia bacterium]
MVRRDVEIVNALGLHARASARFVQVASRFKSRILVTRDGRSANGKSILGLLALIGSPGTRLTISADGSDEGEAVQALVDLVTARFGEDR